MIARILVAIVGAVVITSTLLLSMDAVTSLFGERDGTRYYRVNDVILKDRSGRPDRPPPVARQPETPSAGFDLPSRDVANANPDELLPAVNIPTRILEPDITVPDAPTVDQ